MVNFFHILLLSNSCFISHQDSDSAHSYCGHPLTMDLSDQVQSSLSILIISIILAILIIFIILAILIIFIILLPLVNSEHTASALSPIHHNFVIANILCITLCPHTPR